MEDFTKGELVVSANDPRHYRRLVLKNKLRVLLVSDPEVDKAAAALSVDVGHFMDPPSLPGLAHFLEHMLFLGTEKYPEENEYSSYLSQHGGSSNAFTSHDETNYFFEVGHEFLEGALDRFAQFFLHPLFTESCTDREINAVNSEHHKNLQNDAWRLRQLEKHLSNPNHCFHPFGTGNAQTLRDTPAQLGINVRANLLEFYETYYTSSAMCLSILGRESLDQLEAWAIEKFSEVPERNPAARPEIGFPLEKEHLGKQIKMVPVKDLHELELFWQFPGTEQCFREKPDSYISHLIGHEGPGSILSYLKKKGLASSLSAGATFAADTFSFFKVSIELTKEGLGRTDEVLLAVFQYIDMLKRNGVQKDVFVECQKLAEISFRFKEKQRSAGYVSRLVGAMHTYPGQYILSGSSLFYDYNPEMITQFLNLLTPQNFRFFFVSQSFKSEGPFLEEPWYKTLYQVHDIPQALLETLEKPPVIPDLFIHPKNEFIAEDFAIRPIPSEEVSEYPVLIKDGSLSRVWWKKDSTFLVPKANIQVLFISPLAYSSPETAVATTLYCELLIDELNEFSYAADIAGLKFNLHNNSDGLKLDISGFNDKQKLLLEKIVEKMAHFKPSPEKFKMFRDILDHSYRNWEHEPPSNQVMFNATCLIQDIVWRDQEKLFCLKDLTVEYMEVFSRQLISRLYIETLFHGNLTKTEALELAEIIEKTLAPRPLLEAEIQHSRAVIFPEGLSHWYQETVVNPENENSAIEVYYQVCHYDDDRNRCLTLLVDECLKERFFDQLRTKEQLGYMLGSGVRSTRGSFGIRFIIQSLYLPEYLEERIEAFLEQQIEYFNTIEEKEFTNFQNSLILKKLEKSRNLRQETDRLWRCILSRTYDFDHVHQEVDILRSITKEELARFYTSFLRNKKTQAKLSVVSVSQKVKSSVPEGFKQIESIPRFKEQLYLFPHVKTSQKFLLLK